MICERCRNQTEICIGSKFNAEIVCLDCKEKEDQAEAASESEFHHGIDLPLELKKN
jgi:hypothetical protein